MTGCNRRRLWDPQDFIERWEMEQKTRAQIPLACESDSLQFVQDVLEMCGQPAHVCLYQFTRMHAPARRCVKLHLRHPMLAALVDREELLRRDEALKEVSTAASACQRLAASACQRLASRQVLDEMDDSPGRTAAERKQRIKELTELLAEFKGEETPMVLRGKERLANAKEVTFGGTTVQGLRLRLGDAAADFIRRSIWSNRCLSRRS